MADVLSDFLKKEFVPQPYIIGRGILPRRGKMFIAGSPKTNKSWVVMNMMLDLVRGRRLFDASFKNGAPVFPVNEPYRVLYLEMELGEQGLLERLRGTDGKPGLCTGIDPDGLTLFVQPRDTAMRLDTPQGYDFVKQLCKDAKPDVVVFDPMAKFHLGDENSAMEMGAVMRTADHIIEDFGASVVFVHHIGKQTEDNPRRGGDRLRGSSAIFGDLDTLIEITRKSNEHHPEPVLELSFELRRGEPIDNLFVQRMRDGSVQWLGEGYQFGTPAKNEPMILHSRRRYSNL